MLDPWLFSSDIWNTTATVVAAPLALGLGWVGKSLTTRTRTRRHVGTDREQDMRDLTVTVYGAKKTRANPTPDPGLRDRVTTLEIGQRTLHESVELLTTKLTPNGGNTREAGDLLLLICERLGIPVPERSQDAD